MLCFAKRMGTALRNLSTHGKKKGITLGGCGYGKLTQAAITKCTGYFGKAIHAHPNDLEEMKHAVFTTFHHAISTDKKPDHDLRPKGKESLPESTCCWGSARLSPDQRWDASL